MTFHYHSGNFIWANPKISNTFLPIFPSFVNSLSTKPMAKWSRAPGQFLGGQWVEHKAEFWLFFLSNFQNSSNFQTFYYFLIFLKFGPNVEFIPTNLIIFKVCTSSPNLKFLLYWAHLFSPSQPLCYGKRNLKFKICQISSVMSILNQKKSFSISYSESCRWKL